MKQVKVALTGFGNANKPLFELLVSEEQRLKQDFDLEFLVVGAADSKGSVVAPNGVTARDLLNVRSSQNSVSCLPEHGRPGLKALDMIEQCGADMLVECVPPNLPSAEPGLSHIRRALKLGIHVVTANKAPLALQWYELSRLAKENNVQLRFGSAASASLPTIEQGRLLGETGELLEFAGIFNATCQFVFEGMREGMSYDEALENGRKLGFVETDPSMDLDGWDTAMKTVIQANAYWDADFVLDDVARTGISGITRKDVLKAKNEGKIWCLIGRAHWSTQKKSISVAPECLDLTHPLARVHWCDKVVWMQTRTMGEQVHYGLGASASGTAGTMLADMVSIARNM